MGISTRWNLLLSELRMTCMSLLPITPPITSSPAFSQFTHPIHRPASVVVDAVSLGLLKGSTVDYATELIGSSFSIIDNPQAKGSGCGCGVSWEAKF